MSTIAVSTTRKQTMYHHDPRINDLVLTIINDGDGKQCGMTYADRCKAAMDGIFEFRAACRHYNRYSHMHYGTEHATREQIITAADLLQDYYRNHMAEA